MTDEELKALFESDLQAAARDARVPAAGQVWWRAAMRARADAARDAARPLVWSQGIAAACAVGLAVAAGGAAWPMLVRGTASLEAGSPWAIPLALVLAACLAVVPVVLYVALSDD